MGEHKTNPVVGILGIGFLFAGAAILFYEEADEPEAKHAVNRAQRPGLLARLLPFR